MRPTPTEPLKTISFGTSYVLERLLAVGTIAWLGVLVYQTLNNLLEPFVTGLLAAGSVATFFVTLIIEYLCLPEPVARRSLLKSEASLGRELRLIAGKLGEVNRKLQGVDAEEAEKDSEFRAKNRQCAERERSELSSVAEEERQVVRRFEQQRNAFPQRLVIEIAQALKECQEVTLSQRLSRCYLDGKVIAGIGEDAVMRLARQGIVTAADFVDVTMRRSHYGKYQSETAYLVLPNNRTIHVEGIGPVRASALLEWRNRLASRFKSQLPTRLPVEQETRIKNRHAAELKRHNEDETQAIRVVKKKEEAVISKFRGEKTNLAELERNARNDLERRRRDQLQSRTTLENDQKYTKEWKTKLRDDIVAYRNIRFTAYLRGIVLGNRH